MINLEIGLAILALVMCAVTYSVPQRWAARVLAIFCFILVIYFGAMMSAIGRHDIAVPVFAVTTIVLVVIAKLIIRHRRERKPEYVELHPPRGRYDDWESAFKPDAGAQS